MSRPPADHAANGLKPSLTLARALGSITGPARDFAETFDQSAAAERVADQLLAVVLPERSSDLLFHEAIRKSAADSLEVICRIVAGRAELDMAAGIGPAILAETLAEIGVPLSQFERTYRLGVVIVWQAWYEEAVIFAERTGCSLAELLGAPTMIINSYLDAVLSPLLAEYGGYESTARTRDELKHSILRHILEGRSDLRSSDVEAVLGISLESAHIAFIVRGADREVTPTINAARNSVSSHGAVKYRRGVESWAVWLTKSSGFQQHELESLREVLNQTGLAISLGSAHRGVLGFARTAHEAVAAAEVQALLGSEASRLTFYSDVRMEALFLDRPQSARDFITAELGPLAVSGPRAHEHRKTALAWLTSGSHVATAGLLNIHEHTARNRISQIEGLLGFSLSSRRAELLTALRLHRMLAD